MRSVNKWGIVILLVLIWSIHKSTYGQNALWTNDNVLVHVENGALIHVDGDIVHQNTGVMDNSGTIELNRDWINNSGFSVFLNNSPGLVVMNGFNQRFMGNFVTDFYNLELRNSALKEMFADANVSNLLDIQGSELQLHQNIMHVTNPSTTSITWTNGFVSGDSIGGYLARSTNLNTPYIYPVGDISLFNTYRAVEVTPSNSDSAVYAVRLAAIDPDIDFSGTSFTGSTGPFNRSSLAPDLFGVNSRFYHHVARFHGTNNISTKIYYFASDEILPYEFNGLSAWDNPIPQWANANFNVNFTSGLFNIGNPEKFVLGNISNFGNDVYALAVKNKVTARVPQIFSPNGDGLNDILYVLGYEIEELEFVVYNRWGEKVFETNDINIGWDGTFRGKKAQPGVYVYYLKADLSTSERITQSGDITLVR